MVELGKMFAAAIRGEGGSYADYFLECQRLSRGIK